MRFMIAIESMLSHERFTQKRTLIAHMLMAYLVCPSALLTILKQKAILYHVLILSHNSFLCRKVTSIIISINLLYHYRS